MCSADRGTNTFVGPIFSPCSPLFSPLSPISPHQREVHFRPVRPILTPVDFMLFEQQKLTRFLLSGSLNGSGPQTGGEGGRGTGGGGALAVHYGQEAAITHPALTRGPIAV